MKTLILSLAGSPLSPRALVERTEPPEGGELPIVGSVQGKVGWGYGIGNSCSKVSNWESCWSFYSPGGGSSELTVKI